MNSPSVPPVSLFDDDPSDDPAYVGCRDHSLKRDVREKIEAAWARSWQLCPEGAEQFVSEFRRSFHARVWELYLLDVLTGAGLALEPATGHGPDICLRLPSGTRCWIEAVAPTPGTGPNAFAPLLNDGHAHALPKDTTLILRYRQALEEKLGKLEAYKRDGIVGPDDAYVIAVYQGGLEDSYLYDNELPGLLRAVLPFGDTVFVVHVAKEPGLPEGPRYNQVLQREAVQKANRSPVSTTFFEEPRTESVSAVMFAGTIYGLSWTASTSLTMIHRRGARVAVPVGAIPTRGEMWVEDDGRIGHRGRCAPYGPLAKDEGLATNL